MIDPKEFLVHLQKLGLDFFCGVPDSLLKELNSEIVNNKDILHYVTANEGSAIGLASGYHLSTSKIPVVYLQNSGLGNTLNPLMSLTHENAYQIPIVLIIGWRGRPGIKDEPQHIAQGAKMIEQLKSMDVEYKVLDSDNWEKQCTSIIEGIKTPVALVVKEGSFTKSTSEKRKLPSSLFSMTREEAIEIIATNSNKPIISTTGKTSRELYEIREKLNQNTNDFYTIGCMGHAMSIASGVAIGKENIAICIDGDGSLLMHMGSTSIVNQLTSHGKVHHIVINNFCHESVGGQPTYSEKIDLVKFGEAIGYDKVLQVNNIKNLKEVLKEIENLNENILLEILVKPGSRSDLGRPKSTPIENKNAFMNSLGLDGSYS